MSAGVEVQEGGQDFDLNLAPIIDCFTVLISFMLASASFLAIGVFEASVAANSGTPNPNQKPPAIRVDIELGVGKEVNLRVEGKLNLQKKLPAREGTYDAATLAAELKNLKTKFPDTTGYVLGAADDVEYAEVVGVMETLKKEAPNLATNLGGL